MRKAAPLADAIPLVVVLLALVLVTVARPTGLVIGQSESVGIMATGINSCGSLGSGEYTLTQNITNRAGTCMQITGDNVVLDCQGNFIDGDDSGSDYGISISGRTNVTIKNCLITDFYNAIYSSSSLDVNIITDNVTSNTDTGIYFDKTNFSSVNSTVVENNGYFGIMMYVVKNNTAFNNTVKDNFMEGVYLYSGFNNSIINNTAMGNDDGFYVRLSGNNVFYNNTAQTNDNWGFYLYNSSNNALSYNTARLHQPTGDAGYIISYYSSYNMLDHNSLANNSIGMRLDQNSAFNVITFSTVANNSAHGINIQSDNNNITNSTFSTNYAGITVEASNNFIFHNNFLNNSPRQVQQASGSGNKYNLTFPTGGNYWSDYTGVDGNGDGFGDTAYTFVGGADYLPFMRRAGWDSVAPLWSGQDQNVSTPTQGEPVRLSAYWTDEFGLSMAILATNETGVWQNKSAYGSPYALDGAAAWSNFTWQNASAPSGTSVAWRVYANDTAGNQNVSTDMTFTITDIAPPSWSANATAPASPATYAPGGSYQFNITWTDSSGVSDVILEFAGTNYSYLAGQITNASGVYYKAFTDLAAGSYNYKWFANDTASPANWNSTTTMSYVIDQADNPVNLYLNGTQNANNTYTYPEAVNATGTASVGTVYLYRDGVQKASGSSPQSEQVLLGNGTYAYKVNATGNANYSDNSTGVTFYALVNKGMPDVKAFIDDAAANKTVTYPTSVTIKGNSTTTITPPTFTLYIGALSNSSNPATIGIQQGAGTYQVVYNTSGNANWTATTNDTLYLIIDKAPTAITLLLNGTDGNRSYATGAAANFTLTLNVSGTVFLDTNISGWALQSGITPLVNLTALATAGIYNITGYFPGDANYSASSATHFATVLIADGGSCSASAECFGDYCVHGICRSSPTYCGDTYCDTGEDTASCPADCPAPPPSLELPPAAPPAAPPAPAAPAPPQAAPVEWPEPVVAPPAPGQPVITVPPQVLPMPFPISILLLGGIANKTPEAGTVAILLYPVTNNTAVIHNVTEVRPAQLAMLGCGQTALSGYEINITADIINYCMNYRGKLGNVSEGTLSVWQLAQGAWTELPAEQVLRDTGIICGNITSASTPYMIAGFAPVVGVTPEVALAAIRAANATIAQAEAAGRDAGLARILLLQADAAYINCEYAKAKELADRATASLAGLPVMLIIIIAVLAGVAISVILGYRSLRARVRPKKKR